MGKEKEVNGRSKCLRDRQTENWEEKWKRMDFESFER